MTICPFCGRDPFHYVDIAVGMEAAAVICCENGDMLFRGAREIPDEVTMPWDDFVKIAGTLTELREAVQSSASRKEGDAEIERLRAALKELSDPLTIKGIGGYGFTRALTIINTMSKIARDALNQQKEGGSK